jgi:trimeric autotransporter adhesin
MMSRRTKTAFLLVVALLTALNSTSPASAELSSTPTTSWGVSGLLTGTQTDGIKANVFAMEIIGNTLYVGGRFTTVTNGNTSQSRPAIAAFNATTGSWISSFAPTLDGAVYALQASPDGTRLFVGGDFTTTNGTPTGPLVALNPTTGAISSGWTGAVGGYQVVRDFDVDGTYLYAGGGFTSMSSAAGGTSAFRTARFTLANGTHDATWKPNIAGGTVWGIDVSAASGRVYFAGNFDTINGEARPGGFGAVSATTATNVAGTLSVNTTNVSQQFAYDVLEVGNKVFVAGSQHHLQVLNQSNLSLEVFHRSSPRGDFQTVAQIGSRVYAGSHSYQGTTLASASGVLWVGPPPAGQSDAPIFASNPSSWVSAFNASTGLHDTAFYANLATAGAGIWAVEATSNGCVWFGGAITAAAGVPQFGITRLCDGLPPDTERPSVPSRPQVAALRSGEVDLTWTASTDNVGVVGYRLYNQSNDTLVTDVSGTATTLSLPTGPYEMYLRAYDAAGNVSWRTGPTSFTISDNVDTEAPTTPTGLNGSVSGSTITMWWGESTDNIGVAGYRLFNASNDLPIAAGTGRYTQLMGLAPGPYSYYVKAFDAAGNESFRTDILTLTVNQQN